MLREIDGKPCTKEYERFYIEKDKKGNRANHKYVLYSIKGKRKYPGDKIFYISIDDSPFQLDTNIICNQTESILDIFHLATGYNREKAKFQQCLKNCDAKRIAMCKEVLINR